MSEMKYETPREYIQRWKRVGPKLEAIRRQELRGYVFDAELADELLQMAADHARPRRTSGMSKLYRLLREHYA